MQQPDAKARLAAFIEKQGIADLLPADYQIGFANWTPTEVERAAIDKAVGALQTLDATQNRPPPKYLSEQTLAAIKARELSMRRAFEALTVGLSTDPADTPHSLFDAPLADAAEWFDAAVATNAACAELGVAPDALARWSAAVDRFAMIAAVKASAAKPRRVTWDDTPPPPASLADQTEQAGPPAGGAGAGIVATVRRVRSVCVTTFSVLSWVAFLLSLTRLKPFIDVSVGLGVHTSVVDADGQPNLLQELFGYVRRSTAFSRAVVAPTPGFLANFDEVLWTTMAHHSGRVIESFDLDPSYTFTLLWAVSCGLTWLKRWIATEVHVDVVIDDGTDDVAAPAAVAAAPAAVAAGPDSDDDEGDDLFLATRPAAREPPIDLFR